jgi:uncharacterized Zn finger protein (UPF0148 family)
MKKERELQMRHPTRKSADSAYCPRCQTYIELEKSQEMQVIENPNEEIEPAITSISYGSKEEAEKKIAEYLEGT